MTLEFYNLKDKDNININYFDLYLSHQYGFCMEQSDHAQWEIAVWDNGRIIYPYLKRPYKYNNVIYFDLISPYGYSGFDICDMVTKDDFLAFRKEFLKKANENNYLTEYFRFSPFNINQIKELIQENINIWLKSKTIGIDLRKGYTYYWNKSDKRHRRSINKALKLGYQTEVIRPNVTELVHGDFRRLYNQTMNKVQSSPYYYFNDQYFMELYNNLQDCIYLIHVKDKDNIIVASCLYIKWNNYFHYHLGGSDTNHINNGINNLLHDKAIKVGIENNLELLHLGGGLKDNDSLYNFKYSIGKEIYEFWHGKNIINKDIYEHLIKNIDQKDSNYFPPYRL